ncbi:MAG: formate dehydrogenase accessory sulfurtransferase FdhD [Gemmatimonadota bacterium]
MSERTERIVEETPVALIYNGIPHVVMMATPSDLEDFALGFSITEELIRSPGDLERIEIVRYSQGIEIQTTVPPECETVIASRARRLTGRTGCGICGADSLAAVLKTVHRVPAGRLIAPEAIEAALAGLKALQSLNEAAGAVHAAGWATSAGVIELAREDVGRHNALDKLVGAVLKRGIDPADGFVVVTSRASFEMVQKTAALGAPLLAAISGPTGLAVRVAEQSGLTLVGFARGDRLTVYTHPDRIDPTA